MSNDLQKYENWRAITESDFVTMFIKTWFAFVATLRELNPQDNIENIIGKGDAVFLKPYLKEFEKKYLAYNKFEVVKSNILRVYSLGRKYVVNNSKYNRFFYEDFYTLNEKYKIKKETEKFLCTIRYSGNGIITINVVIKDDRYKTNKTPLIHKSKTDISDLLNIKNIAVPERYRDDEAAYLNEFYEEVKKRITGTVLETFENANYSSKYNSKDYKALEILFKQDIYLLLNNVFSKTTIDIATDNELLYYQVPCLNFLYKLSENLYVPITKTFEWFLKFVYFLRNALFHEIIDPLEKFWQDIFKHAYLALKEILDGNIWYLKEKKAIVNLINIQVWGEIRKNLNIFLTDINEQANNSSDLNIVFIDYNVNIDEITLKAIIKLEYWTITDELKQVDLLCKAKADRAKVEFSKFELKKTGEKILNSSN